MSTKRNRCLGVCAVLIASIGACKDDAASDHAGSGTGALQCESDSYVAFDSANHESQDVRVATSTKLASLMEEAVMLLADGKVEEAQAKFEDAKALYTNPDETAALRTKVMERLDQHVAGDPLQGTRMDFTIVAWLDFGAKADTELEAAVAKESVEKTLLEFFFLSVHHELLEGARDKWDEAFGYYGSGVDNDEGAAQGLASLAAERDAKNGTDLRAEIYNALIDGSCVLDGALTEMDTDVLDVHEVSEMHEVVTDIDGSLQRVLAYSVGHEAYEMNELLEAGSPDPTEVTVEAAELRALFLPLERIMLDQGGAAADRAQELREIVDAMPVGDPTTLDLADDSWIDALGEGPARVVELLEAQYAIDIQG